MAILFHIATTYHLLLRILLKLFILSMTWNVFSLWKELFKKLIKNRQVILLKKCDFSVSWFENVMKWRAWVTENNVAKMSLCSSQIGAPHRQQKVSLNAWQHFSETTWSMWSMRDCTSGQILPTLLRGFSELFSSNSFARIFRTLTVPSSRRGAS